MPRYLVGYGDASQDFELSAENVVDCWSGPEGLGREAAAEALRAAVEAPRDDYPPLSRTVVPGDVVAVALDPGIQRPDDLVAVLSAVLKTSGVEAESIRVVSPSPSAVEGAEVHDPSNREKLAYLATTKEGRRVYFNRTLADADVVLPVGLLRYDPVVGRHGPWSLLFPGLADQAAVESYRRTTRLEPDDLEFPAPRLDEPLEACWLLGSALQIGVVPGVEGPAEFVVGRVESVRDEGARAVDRLWSFRPRARAELVVAGIGRPGLPTTIDDLAAGLETAGRLVRRGGRIAALCPVREAVGPAFQRLIAAGDAISSPTALSGREADPDAVAARRLARVLDRADVYLFSGLDREVVEDLSMIAVDRPEDLRRLAARASSCTFVSQAELARALAPDHDPS